MFETIKRCRIFSRHAELLLTNIFHLFRDIVILVYLGEKTLIYVQVIQKSTRISNLFSPGSMYVSVSVFCFEVMKKPSHILL